MKLIKVRELLFAERCRPTGKVGPVVRCAGAEQLCLSLYRRYGVRTLYRRTSWLPST